MADEKGKILAKKSSDRLRSPDDLDEYMRVTNPSVWVALTVCIVVLVGLFAWGVFGTAETSVSSTGTYVNGEVVCFLPAEKVTNIHLGDDANVGGERMQVESVSAVPVSRVEAREIVGGDYLTTTLVENDWAYVVRFKGDGDYSFNEGVPLSVTITTEHIAPISLIFKDAA